jgi:hypothetical protein
MQTYESGHVNKEAFVFSVAPYVANMKVFGHGPTYHIAAKPAGARYSTTKVIDATCFKDFGEGQKEMYVVDAFGMAQDLVRDCEPMGVWCSEDAKPTEAEIKAAEEKQRAFYLSQIAEGDSVWARTQDPKQIPFHARVGARELNMARDWAKDTSTMAPCPACRELVLPDAVKCSKCSAILDWKRAAAMGIATREQLEFAREQGLIEPVKAKK